MDSEKDGEHEDGMEDDDTEEGEQQHHGEEEGEEVRDGGEKEEEEQKLVLYHFRQKCQYGYFPKNPWEFKSKVLSIS